MKNSHTTSAPVAQEYGFTLLLTATSTLISFAIFSRFALINLVMVYLLGIVVVASRGYRGPAALASLLSVGCFDFFFVPPRFSIEVSDAQYLFTFAVMFIAAMLISHLTVRLREEAWAAHKSATQTNAMHEFTRRLSSVHGQNQVLASAFQDMSVSLDADVAAFIAAPQGTLEFRMIPDGTAPPTEKERGVAQWVYDKSEAAGLGVEALPSEAALYVPLRGAGTTLGVLRVKPQNNQPLADDQRQLLESFSKQVALALELDRLQQKTHHAEIEVETERLRSTLLSSVSHDFRTPLTAIVGSASTLLQRAEIRANDQAAELIATIQDEAERLSRQIENLLETTRLDAGVQIRKEKFPIEELIGSALERVAKTLQGRQVDVEIADNFPLLDVDGLLLEQVFINLLENAARHAPTGTIVLTAEVKGRFALLSVVDRGPGLKQQELEQVFEKFYRRASSPGAGLGLSICRAIVTAHGGTISAENRDGGGAAFRFTIPLETA